MCAIQNFHIDWIIDNARDEELNEGIGRIGEDGNLYLTSSEITSITKKYVRLYKNRQSKLHNDRNEKYIENSVQKQKYGELPTFTPKISHATTRMASRDPSRSSVRIEDRLIKEKLDINLKVHEMRLLKIKEEVN
jgi:hypothetical protein